jgi:predicted metal-dependent hydrolase
MLDTLKRLLYIYATPKNGPAMGPDSGLDMATQMLEQQARLKRISTRLKLRVSKRARRMTLRLDPDTRHVHLVVPQRASLNRAFDFAEEHKIWIREKISSLPKPVPFTDGAIIPFFGRDHYLEIVRDRSQRSTVIDIKNRIMTVETSLDDASARIERHLRTWIQNELTILAQEKATMIRRKLGIVRVRETKSRWGSCAEDGNLSFSWRLIFAPREVIDYVVAHEVAHLVHFDHAPAFWRLCDRLSVDMNYGRDWLKENGASLMCYGRKP